LRIELEKVEDDGKRISDLNRAIEAIIEKLATRAAQTATGRQQLQAPEAVTEILQQLFSDPSTASYADDLMTAINEIDMQEGLLGHLDRPQMVTPLWDHQREALANWYDTGKQGYVDMATATGKTVLGLAAIAQQFGDLHPYDAESIPDESAGEQPEHVLIVAGQDLLLEQWQSEFDEHLNIPRDRMQPTGDGRTIELSWGTIEFRTAQDLLTTDRLRSYELVILDEAHRYRRGTSGEHGWRDLFETLTNNAKCLLAMSGSIDQDWLGDATARDALEGNLTQCMEFTVADAREANVIADFSWNICYAASTKGEALESVAESTKTLAAVYDEANHKFRPRDLADDVPDTVAETYETLRDLRAFAHTKEGNKARETSAAFDKFATAAFARQPKRWQLSPPNETIEQLLDPHVENEKAIVLAQSYTQSESIGAALSAAYISDFVTVPDRNDDSHFEVIREFKQRDAGVLIGPGEVFGVGIDLPNVDIAINLSKGGVNASLVQRIGRVLRNPSGANRAQFYQVIMLPATPDARLAGEDGRRLLRRASEFRALGARFRELPGFVAVDATSKSALLELETNGAMAARKDHRDTIEIVGDDVAADNLTSILDVITAANSERTEPALTTEWHSKSIEPHTEPVRDAVEGTATGSNMEDQDEVTHPVSVTVRDRDGNPVPDVSVTASEGSFDFTGTTDQHGGIRIELPAEIQAITLEFDHQNYEPHLSRLPIDGGYTDTTIRLSKDLEADLDTESPGMTDTSTAGTQPMRTITVQLASDDGPITGATITPDGIASASGQTSAVGTCDIKVPAEADQINLSVEHPDPYIEDFTLDISSTKHFYTIQYHPTDQDTRSDDSTSESPDDTTDSDEKPADDEENPNRSVVDGIMSRLDL
jgi:superfamily II DNA or RNA helicase